MADEDNKVIGYTSEGLVLYTYNEILEKLTTGLNGIYGSDLSTDSSDPDMQWVRILAQLISDEHDTMRQLDNSFNPDTARGAAQDYRYRLNNVERKNGAYTSMPITFTIQNEVTTLDGLDGQEPDEGSAWGVTDGTYNFLLNSTEEFQTGTYTRQVTCTQRVAANPPIGSVTQQIQDTSNINVTDITNGAPTAIGAPNEKDEAFSNRRQQSFVNSGMNCCDSITRQLLNLSTVVNAKAYEHDYTNYPDGPDADGIPLNCIWVVVDGGSSIEIVKAIYENISGTDTKGEQSDTVISDSGQSLTFNFDYATTNSIFLKFTLQKLYPTFNITLDNLKQTISDNTSIDINSSIDSSTMNDIIKNAISSNAETVQLGAVPINIELSSDNSTWTEFLEAAGKQIKYVLPPDNISITVQE